MADVQNKWRTPLAVNSLYYQPIIHADVILTTWLKSIVKKNEKKIKIAVCKYKIWNSVPEVYGPEWQPFRHIFFGHSGPGRNSLGRNDTHSLIGYAYITCWPFAFIKLSPFICDTVQYRR